MNIQNQLNECYTAQASHFHHTRWFFKRPELEHIAPLLQPYNNSSATLVDLWCGSGRISERIQSKWYDITYIWVDPAPWMIDLANTQYADTQFINNDMLSFLQESKQQSIDVILCLASFHHLQDHHTRLITLQNIYRTLNYGWTAILVNRSYSDRFVQKYKKQCLQAIATSVLTLWNKKRNDVHIPRKDTHHQENQEVYYRYYHMFTLSEIKKLVKLTDFGLQEVCYIAQDGSKTHNRKESRNSFVILKK